METGAITPKVPFWKLSNLKADKVILILVLFLSAVSVVMVYSMRGEVVLQHLKHLLFGYLGMFAVYKVDYRKIGVAAPAILLFAIVLMVLTMLSQAVRGITILGRDVQTFYVIGFLLIFYIAHYIAKQYHVNGEISSSNARILFALLGVFCACIATMNMSTAIILFMTGLVLFFVGGFKLKDLGWMVGLVSILLVIAVIVAVNLSDAKQAKFGRMGTFINRLEYYITKDNTDGYGDQMILAETGIVVGVAILFAYLIFFYRSRKIAKEATGAFGRLLAFGIGFWITCQALVHIGVNCELLPTTGQTLPFVSSGGASLFVTGCAIGMLLNIGKVSAEENEKEDPMALLRQR